MCDQMIHKKVLLPYGRTECSIQVCTYGSRSKSGRITCRSPEVFHANNDAYCHDMSRRYVLEKYLTVKQRGGKREGAGRPKTGNARIKTSVTLEPDLHEWASGQTGSLSDVINNALRGLKNERL